MPIQIRGSAWETWGKRCSRARVPARLSKLHHLQVPALLVSKEGRNKGPRHKGTHTDTQEVSSWG